MNRVYDIVVAGLVMVQVGLTRVRERATRAEQGQSLVEYALILAFIVVAVVLAFKFLQPAIADTFNRVTNTLTTSGTPMPGPTPTP